MADYEVLSHEFELFQEKDNVTDLQAYYMTQFNLELENGSSKCKNKVDSFKFGTEESFDFEVLDNWDSANTNTDFEVIDQVIDTNINEQNFKEVLLDLDGIEFDDQSFKTESNGSTKETETNFYETNDYIDDESLIDELCREDGESCRLTPDFNEEYAANEKNSLPSIETAFSKKYCHYNNLESSLPCNQVGNLNDSQIINSLEHYSYPNNILFNLESNKSYLPETPTSVQEFNFGKTERKISVSDSIESEHTSYYDGNSECFEDDDLFIHLDDYELGFERNSTENNIDVNDRKGEVKEKTQGERTCLWEHCYERYPNQSTLVEHIERAHVNSYIGDEFSCLWRDCSRGRRPFNARYKLLIHMRVHSGHKPNRCHHPGCGKAFSRLENLKIHVRSHTGERPYACLAPHCRKAFSNSSDRAKHQRTHFNARPYACGAIGCGKRYTDPSSLRKHVKSHPHITSVPRTCIPPSRPIRRDHEQLVPSSPAKLTTLRCIRDKLTVPRLQRI